MTNYQLLRLVLETLRITLSAIHDRYEAGEVPEQPEFAAELLSPILCHVAEILAATPDGCEETNDGKTE